MEVNMQTPKRPPVALWRSRLSRYTGLWSWLCVCMLALCLCATQAVAQSKTISLADALRLLLKRNPTLARERLTVRQAQASLQVARGAFGFDLSLDLGLDRSTLPLEMSNAASLIGSLPDLSLNDLRIEGILDLTKRFELGTTVMMRLRSWWRNQDQLDFTKAAAGQPDPRIQAENSSNSLLLQVSQPLLRGAWLHVNTAPIRQAQEQILVAREQVLRAVTQSVASVERAYWDLVYAKKSLQIQKGALALAQKQLRSTMALIKAGKLAELEKYQVQQVVATQQAELLNAQTLLERAETELRVLLFLPANVTLQPSDKLEQQEKLQALPALLKLAVTSNPELLVAMRTLKIARLSVVSSKNATLPRLDLQAGFTFVGFGRRVSNATDQSNPAGRSWALLFDPRSSSFQVGVKFIVPLDNRQAQHRLQRDRIEVNRAQLLIAGLQRQLLLQVRQLYWAAKRLQMQIPIGKAALLWAKKKLEAEESKFSLGRSTLFNVLRYQQDLAAAQLAASRNLVEYKKAMTSLLERAGTLLRHRGIQKAQ